MAKYRRSVVHSCVGCSSDTTDADMGFFQQTHNYTQYDMPWNAILQLFGDIFKKKLNLHKTEFTNSEVEKEKYQNII